MLSRLFRLLLLALLSVHVHSLVPTDEIRDADEAQSGYLNNHNMDPAIVGSSKFKMLWQHAHNPNERFYAKPLIYTPPGGRRMVFVASNQNIIRLYDAVTGTLLKSRTLQPPFLASDTGCGDIPNTVGITGTPILDPGSHIVYFFSKGYHNGATSGGITQGRFLLYGVNILTLADAPSFPVQIDGHHAVNDPKKYFVGGVINQRTSLIIRSGTVVGGFGSVCDFFNYTGMLVGVDKTSAAVTQVYAMEGGPGAIPETNNLQGDGGRAGVWMGGMGFSSDGQGRIYFVTGNGNGHANGNTPHPGSAPLTTLDEVVARFQVNTGGTFALQDYFEPSDYMSVDSRDLDIGSGGFSLLDPSVFVRPGVTRMGVTAGKNSKIYVLNALNLGGLDQGSGGTDASLQEIGLPGPVWGGMGSYPLEGGYIYVTPSGHQTLAYKFVGGSFQPAGHSAASASNHQGIGTPTTTSVGSTAGTGILWICDPGTTPGLRAFRAVPVNGVLEPIPIPAINAGCNKFQRPAFGNGKLYVTDINGVLYCMGS